MNGYCNSCDNHCATNEMRCERGYRAMGYEMGREMSGAMIRNMQHAQPPRDFREIGQRFAGDVARQARGGGFEAKARRFADDAARAAREAQALREAGRKLAEAIAANAGEAGETEATRESAKHFAETVAANIGESARAEALRQAAGKLAEAVDAGVGDDGARGASAGRMSPQTSPSGNSTDSYLLVSGASQMTAKSSKPRSRRSVTCSVSPLVMW